MSDAFPVKVDMVSQGDCQGEKLTRAFAATTGLMVDRIQDDGFFRVH